MHTHHAFRPCLEDIQLEDRILLNAAQGPTAQPAAEVAPVAAEGTGAAPATPGVLSAGGLGGLGGGQLGGSVGPEAHTRIGGPTTIDPAASTIAAPVFVGGFNNGFFTGFGNAYHLNALGNPYGNTLLGYGPEFGGGFTTMIGYDGFNGYGNGYSGTHVDNEFGVNLAYTPFQNPSGPVSTLHLYAGGAPSGGSFAVSTGLVGSRPVVGGAGLSSGSVGFPGAGTARGFGSGGGSGALDASRLLVTSGSFGGLTSQGGFGSPGSSGSAGGGSGSAATQPLSPSFGSGSGLFGRSGFGLFGGIRALSATGGSGGSSGGGGAR